MKSETIRKFVRGDKRRNIYATAVVCGRNELPTQLPARPCLYIVNSLSTFESGIGHWTCFVFPHSERGNKCIFFDPLGKSPSEYGTEFMLFYNIGNCVGLRANVHPVQCRTSVKCGEYCIYFALRYGETGDSNAVILEILGTGESQLLSKLTGI